jgi:hypothetical protein
MGSGALGRGRRTPKRRRAAALACALGVLALLAAGCGVEEHANEPRPQPPTRVSVAVAESGITVDPPRIAFGPEPTQQIPQNREAEQPPVVSDEPLDVILVAANLTETESRLRVRGPRREANSPTLVAQGNISLLAALPTGVYEVSAANLPDVEPATLTVGPYRSSSENDLLLP